MAQQLTKKQHNGNQLKQAGADKVWLQPVKVPVWVRGKESLHIKTANGQWQYVNMLSLGNSEGTNGKDLTGDIILVKTIEEFNALPESTVKGKIVFFNNSFNQSYITTFLGYRDAGIYRRATASMVAKRRKSRNHQIFVLRYRRRPTYRSDEV